MGVGEESSGAGGKGKRIEKRSVDGGGGGGGGGGRGGGAKKRDRFCLHCVTEIRERLHKRAQADRSCKSDETVGGGTPYRQRARVAMDPSIMTRRNADHICERRNGHQAGGDKVDRLPVQICNGCAVAKRKINHRNLEPDLLPDSLSFFGKPWWSLWQRT